MDDSQVVIKMEIYWNRTIAHGWLLFEDLYKVNFLIVFGRKSGDLQTFTLHFDSSYRHVKRGCSRYWAAVDHLDRVVTCLMGDYQLKSQVCRRWSEGGAAAA